MVRECREAGTRSWLSRVVPVKMKHRRKLQSILLLFVRVSGYPVEGSLDEDRDRLRGRRCRQMGSLKSGTIFVGQPAEVDFRPIRSRPGGLAANLFGLRVLLPAVLQHALFLERDPITAFPFREITPVWVDVLALTHDGNDRSVRGQRHGQQTHQANRPSEHDASLRERRLELSRCLKKHSIETLLGCLTIKRVGVAVCVS